MRFFNLRSLSLTLLALSSSAGVSAAETTREAATLFLKSLTREVQQKGDVRLQVQDVLAMRAKGEALTLIDIRTPQERGLVAIPNSLKIPLNELGEHLEKIPRDHRVIMVCHSGPRSVIATTVLRMLGYHNVYALNGGIHSLADINARTAPELAPNNQQNSTKTTKKKVADDEVSELGGDDFSCD